MRSSGKTKSISSDTVEVLRNDISTKSPVPFGFHPDGYLITPNPRAMSQVCKDFQRRQGQNTLPQNR